MEEIWKLTKNLEWPQEHDLKGAVLGNLWHFYQIMLHEDNQIIELLVSQTFVSSALLGTVKTALSNQ